MEQISKKTIGVNKKGNKLEPVYYSNIIIASESVLSKGHG